MNHHSSESTAVGRGDGKDLDLELLRVTVQMHPREIRHVLKSDILSHRNCCHVWHTETQSIHPKVLMLNERKENGMSAECVKERSI